MWNSYPLKCKIRKKQRMTYLEPLKAFIVSRSLILIIIVLSSQFTTTTIPAREGINYNPTISLDVSKVSTSLKKIFLSADASWYIEIAQNGYHDPTPEPTALNWVFFPLLPLLISCLKPIFGSYLLAGVLISNLCFFLSLLFLHRLALMRGFSTAQASRCIWFLALYPTSYFFINPLTEAVFLLLLILSFFLLEKEKYLCSGVLMLLVTATRPTGLLILPAFCFRIWEKSKFRVPRGILALLLAPLGILFFSVYLFQHTGDALAWLSNQANWGRNDLGFVTLISQYQLDFSTLMLPWNFTALNILAAILTLGVALHFALSGNLSWTLLLAVPVLAALSTGTLQSMTRFTMILFPLYFCLARFADNPTVEKIILSVSSALLALMTALYAYHVTAAMA